MNTVKFQTKEKKKINVLKWWVKIIPPLISVKAPFWYLALWLFLEIIIKKKSMSWSAQLGGHFSLASWMFQARIGPLWVSGHIMRIRSRFIKPFRVPFNWRSGWTSSTWGCNFCNGRGGGNQWQPLLVLWHHQQSLCLPFSLQDSDFY